MSRKRRKFEKIYKWEVKKRLSSYIDPDTGEYEFEGAVQTTMYVEFEGPPSNRTCAVSMNFASTYQQPWK